jgi:hypothetical protein
MQGRLSFLCAALFLNKIYPPVTFQFDTSNTFLDKLQTKVWKISKDNNSKIIKGRVLILIVLAKSIPSPHKRFHVDISKAFWDMLRTKNMGRKDGGRKDGNYNYIGGDNKKRKHFFILCF